MTAAENTETHVLISSFLDGYYEGGVEASEQCALDLLASLKEAGYAVVELPEPSYVDDPEGDGEKGFGFNGPPGDSALAEHGVYAYEGKVFDQYDGWTPAQARTVGTWWLAAAAAAEVSQ